MELDLEIMISDTENLESLLISPDGTLTSKIEIENGIYVMPQFTSIGSKRAVGDLDILLFILGIPTGIAVDILANIIFEWLTRNKVQRVRIKRKEIIIMKGKDEFIRQFSETIEE